MSAEVELSRSPAARSTQLRELAWRAGRGWPWTPLPFAAVYVVLLLGTLGSVVSSLYRSADIVSAPVIGELLPRAPDGAYVTLGNIPWYPALWFESLTRGLPDHRQVWELAPWIFSLGGIALMAWATTRVADRWAGMIVAVTCGCAGPALLTNQFSWSVHALAYVHVCVLAAFLVLLALEPRQIARRGWRRWLALTVVTLITGVGVASDELVIIAGLIPFVLAGSVWAWVAPRETARRAIVTVSGVTAGSAITAVVITAVMTADHVVAASFPISFSPFHELLAHVGDVAASLALLVNGNFDGAALSITSVTGFAAAVLINVGAYASLRYGRRVMPPGAGHLHRVRVEEPQALARTAFLSYWLLSGLTLSAAFVFSSVPVGALTLRYLVPLLYAIVTVVAVAAARIAWGRALVTAAACVFVATSILTVDQRQIQGAAGAYPGPGVARDLLGFARSQHLTVGYAGYWDSAALTWQQHERVLVYPIANCGGQACPPPFHAISSWYVPRRRTRTFLAVDSEQAAGNGISAPFASFGKPEQVARIGRLTVYVYGYDVAARFGA